MLTNEQVIRSLYNDSVDVTRPWEVFEYVFLALPDEIFVFPTENYYYFQVFLNGRVIHGSLNFYADQLEKGRFEFSYSETTVGRTEKSPAEGWLALGLSDSVELTQRDDFHYSLRVRDKTVRIRLNEIDLDPPSAATMLPSEIFVANTFDESGIPFHLNYLQSCRGFLWILNDQDPIPEEFVELSQGLLLGTRTGFAFFDDEKRDRLVLVGVSAREEAENTWYDGPFDQLPDNQIRTGKVDLQTYLEEAHPDLRGRIDAFGNFLNDPLNRSAITPYKAYGGRGELRSFIEDGKRSAASDEEFFCQIAREG